MTVANDEIAGTYKSAADDFVVVVYGDDREVHVPAMRGRCDIVTATIEPEADTRRTRAIDSRDDVLVGPRRRGSR